MRGNLADAQEVSSDTTITQDAAESKENNAAVQKTVRFALGAPVEVDGQKELVAVHNLTEQNLREAQQLRGVPGGVVGGVQLGDHEPVFDITVSAAKKSTFSRLSQNETAKECYQLGFFAPANADAALAALEMVDFEGIEKVRERVSQNGTLYQQLQQMAAQLQKMAAIIDSQNGTNVAAAASAAGQAAGAAGAVGGGSTGAKTSTNSLGGAVGGSDNSLSTQAARRAMDVNNPNK